MTKKIKIDTLNPKTLEILRLAITEALAAVGEAHGVSLKTAGATYDPEAGFATMKLSIGVLGKDGQAATRESRDFLGYLFSHGLAKTDLGRTFTTPGSKREMTIAGYKPRGHKIVTKDANGKGWLIDADVVNRTLYPEGRKVDFPDIKFSDDVLKTRF